MEKDLELKKMIKTVKEILKKDKDFDVSNIILCVADGIAEDLVPAHCQIEANFVFICNFIGQLMKNIEEYFNLDPLMVDFLCKCINENLKTMEVSFKAKENKDEQD